MDTEILLIGNGNGNSCIPDINNGMITQEKQLQTAINQVKKLERVVQHLVLRVSALERLNAKLKSAVSKQGSDIANIDNKLRRL